MLPAAPHDPVGPDGLPLFGRYAGYASRFGWHRLAAPYARGALWRRLHHKRWHFVALTTDELFCAFAVVDIGWGNSAFGYAFDRRRRQLVEAFSIIGIAGLSADVGGDARAPARFRWPGVAIDIEPAAAGGHAARVRSRRLKVDAGYGGSAPCLLAVGQPAGGSVHATQKSGALPVTGAVEVDGVRYDLGGGVASFDYSNGLVGRDTEWRWLSGHAPGLGINLQSGYFGGAENALWLDEAIVPLAAAQLDVGPQGWKIGTADGLVDLTFTPEVTRHDSKQLVVASSRLVQQLGVFDGWVKASPGAPPRQVRRVPGITEQHRARW